MAAPIARINLTGARLEPFPDNASALAAVTAPDDAGVDQFDPSVFLQGDGTPLSSLTPDRLVPLLVDICETAVPAEGLTASALDLTTLFGTARTGDGDVATKDLRARRAVISRAFEFLVVSATHAGVAQTGMRRVTIGDNIYTLLPSRQELSQLPEPATSSPATTPPPSSILGKHGRADDDGSSKEPAAAAKSGSGQGAAAPLRTDFDIPKQVRLV